MRSDADLNRDVLDELKREPSLDPASVAALKSNVLVPADKITVTVSKGNLKLEGEVEWVHTVENKITVSP